MASILVQYRKSKRWRMWNTVVDAWVTPIMNREKAHSYLVNECEHTKAQATRRLNRTGYKRDHKLWLNRFFDSKVASLTRTHRRLHGSK